MSGATPRRQLTYLMSGRAAQAAANRRVRPARSIVPSRAVGKSFDAPLDECQLLVRPGRSLRYPRERLISALPLLLSESGSLQASV